MYEPSPMGTDVAGKQGGKRDGYDGVNNCPDFPCMMVVAMAGYVQGYAREDGKKSQWI